MGPVKLAFNGTDAGLNYPEPSPLPAVGEAVKTSIVILSPQAGGVQADTVLYVSVTFNVPLGGGKTILLVPTQAGGLRYEVFERNGVSRMIAVPFTEKGLWIYYIDPFLKGYVSVSTSK
jgi:hypothetical protein